MRRALQLLLAGSVLALIAAGAASAHRSGCHSAHTCPSDHHTYPWQGLWCTSYADERLPTDTKTVSYDGRLYWCHGSGSAATAAAGSTGAPSSSGGAAACGVERWTVKTLQDRPRLLPAQATTVAHLASLAAPGELPPTRLPFERHIFTVTAAVTLVRPEDDSDFQLVLVEAGRHMIAESPNPACAPGATLLRRQQMAAARKAVRLCSRARVTGVAFFDFEHGQTGVAPNAIELHPMLGFRCLA